MRGRTQRSNEWENQDQDAYYDNAGYDQNAYGNYQSYDPQYAQEQYNDEQGYDNNDNGEWYGDDERGLMLQPEHSLVGVSNTVTHHGVPLLSYTRTMNRFYTSRKQRLSFGRFKCEVCGERIRWWAWETGTGTRTHDGCYERLAWTWTNLYAQQQKLASQGLFE